MPGLKVFLFGRPRIDQDDVSVTVARRKALALLAYLAVTRQAHSRDALVVLLWPELDGERGRAVLRSTLADLSQAIGKGALAVEGDQVACQAPPLRVDIARFQDLLAQVVGHNDPPSRPCDDCLAALSEAVGLYRADFLAGFTLKDVVEFAAWQTFQAPGAARRRDNRPTRPTHTQLGSYGPTTIRSYFTSIAYQPTTVNPTVCWPGANGSRRT